MTEFTDELNRLKKLQKAGKLSKNQDLEKYARWMIQWRKSDDKIDKQNLVDNGSDEDLDRLVRDADPDVRQAVAENGRPKDLDILVDDPDWRVRNEVAWHERPQDLDKLVYDKNENVRETVAYVGQLKHLEILADDDSAFVLQTVAQRLLELLDEQKTGQFSERI